MIKASGSSRDSSRSGRSFTPGSSDDREDLSSATAPLPPGTFTTSAHSDEWKIANALSAGPASITEHATVIDWPANPKDGMSPGRVLRQGTNGWTCDLATSRSSIGL